MELLNTISTSRTWNRHGLKIAYAISIALFLLAIAASAWDFYNKDRLRKTHYAAQDIKPISAGPKKSYRISDAVQANLFGDSTPVAVVEEARETTLDLTLQGILSASNSNLARAIIMSGRRKSELYSVGEDIKGAGVSIKEIRDHEVLLNRGGAVESLPLKKNKSSGNNSLISYTGGSSGTFSDRGFDTAAAREFEELSRSRWKAQENSKT